MNEEKREYYNQIRLSLTDEEIINIFHKLGVDRYENKNDYIVFPTICHNANENTASMKLFYYKNTKLFHCYTDCGDTFDIFKLLERYYTVRGIKYNFFSDILYFIRSNATGYRGIEFDNFENGGYNSITDKYKRKVAPEIKTISDNVLSTFVNYYPTEWIEEGITKEVMDKFNIKFSITQNKIIIPHYNINGDLVGIRGRALNPEDIEKGKYRPVVIEGVTYSHPLSLNLYGLNITKDYIKQLGYCIVFEGEKSVLLMDKYYPNKNTSVATCGSNFHKTQLDLLVSLGVKEIIVAYDKENTNSSLSDSYFDKLYKMCSKYKHYCNISFIFDQKNLLQDKDSPIDKGKEIFEELLSKRVKI